MIILDCISNFKCNILSLKEIQKKDKNLYIVKLYISFCDYIVTCFVNKDVYDSIKSGYITDNNLSEHLYIYINSAKEISFAVKE